MRLVWTICGWFGQGFENCKIFYAWFGQQNFYAFNLDKEFRFFIDLFIDFHRFFIDLDRFSTDLITIHTN